MADYPILCWSSLSGLHTLQECWRSSSGSSAKPDQGGQQRVLLAGGRDSSSRGGGANDVISLPLPTRFVPGRDFSSG